MLKARPTSGCPHAGGSPSRAPAFLRGFCGGRVTEGPGGEESPAAPAGPGRASGALGESLSVAERVGRKRRRCGPAQPRLCRWLPGCVTVSELTERRFERGRFAVSVGSGAVKHYRPRTLGCTSHAAGSGCRSEAPGADGASPWGGAALPRARLEAGPQTHLLRSEARSLCLLFFMKT